jgi:hypothetical protein
MTDNEPLFEKDVNIWRSLDHGSDALSSLDRSMERARKRLATLLTMDLEHAHVAMYHAKLDRLRNDLAYELAQLAESYGHPDWEVDE